MQFSSFLLAHVRPFGHGPIDLLIRDGRIAALGTTLPHDGLPVEDGGGYLLLPGLVDAHTHLDKSFLGYTWQPNSGRESIADIIANERRLKSKLALDAERQSQLQILQSVRFGTSHIRSHVDIDPQVGLTSLHGVMRSRERLADMAGVEIVAFPQWGLLTRPGTAQLMEQAMREGADVVGGLDPSAIDRDPKAHLDFVFNLAERFGKPVDIHLHELGDLGAFSIHGICHRTLVLGMQGKVTISHAFSLGAEDEDLVARQIDDLATAGVAIMTTGPSGYAAPPVAKLKTAGVVVCAGNDGMRDAWQPYGDGDMLARANAVAQRNGFVADNDLTMALDTCTTGGATVMHLGDYGLTKGSRADFVLVDAQTIGEAVACPPERRTVFKNGKVVVKCGAFCVSSAIADREACV